MSTLPAQQLPSAKRADAPTRATYSGALFWLLQLSRKVLSIRENHGSWVAFRVLLGFAGAALVILPVSSMNGWPASVVGLIMFLAAILLPGARPRSLLSEKIREFGAFAVVDGGEYQAGNGDPCAAQLFLTVDRIWALDSHFQPLITIPVGEISWFERQQKQNGWLVAVQWSDRSVEFSYRGIFAEHLAGAAESAIHAIAPAPRYAPDKALAAKA